MNKFLVIILIYVVASQFVEAKTIKVAVIDTGYNFAFKDFKHFKLSKPKLCKTGHKDFTDTTLNDVIGHGSNIASIIAQGNEAQDYCILVLKFYSKETQLISLETELEAIRYAIKQKVNIINMSLSGYAYSKEECDLVKVALDRGITIVAAAGNDGFDLSVTKVYPAMCDKRVKVVMNYTKGERASSSNYDDSYIKENGTNIYGLSKGNLPEFMSGTSQAAANHTNRLVRKLGK